MLWHLKGLESWDARRVNIYVEAHWLWLQLPGPALLSERLFTVAGTLCSLCMLTCNYWVNSGPWNRWGFFFPTAFFIMLPTFVVQGRSTGWNWLFVCTASLWGLLCRWISPDATHVSFLVSAFSSIQLCSLSLVMMFDVCIFSKDSGNLTCDECPVHASKLFLLDIFICSPWQTVISAHWEKSVAAVLHRSNPFALVTMGQRLSVPIVTNQNKTLPTATQHEAQFKAASKENQKCQRVYALLSRLTITLRCGYLLSHALKWTMPFGHWNHRIHKAFRAPLHIAYDQVQVHSNLFPAGLYAVTQGWSFELCRTNLCK